MSDELSIVLLSFFKVPDHQTSFHYRRMVHTHIHSHVGGGVVELETLALIVHPSLT